MILEAPHFSRRMPAEVKKEIELEIAHVLFIEIVAYSRLSVNEQHARIEELNEIVRSLRAIPEGGSGKPHFKDPCRRRHGAGLLQKSGGTGAVCV
jgi:hypothetical protein